MPYMDSIYGKKIGDNDMRTPMEEQHKKGPSGPMELNGLSEALNDYDPMIGSIGNEK